MSRKAVRRWALPLLLAVTVMVSACPPEQEPVCDATFVVADVSLCALGPIQNPSDQGFGGQTEFVWGSVRTSPSGASLSIGAATTTNGWADYKEIWFDVWETVSGGTALDGFDVGTYGSMDESTHQRRFDLRQNGRDWRDTGAGSITITALELGPANSGTRTINRLDATFTLETTDGPLTGSITINRPL